MALDRVASIALDRAAFIALDGVAFIALGLRVAFIALDRVVFISVVFMVFFVFFMVFMVFMVFVVFIAFMGAMIVSSKVNLNWLELRYNRSDRLGLEQGFNTWLTVGCIFPGTGNSWRHVT